ncbi:MAG: PP2C family protein-serine/threonine phosphatase [Phycisphaerales bacterium]|jgi:serine phosphatase RsbU (regulator of sigma subunit)|nr:PP2C family protein-serine/threonine phosphatase [Phycisphaerales bacterium]
MSRSKYNTTGAAFTQEFHHEFRAETDRLLRRRFLWFAGLMLALNLVGFVLILSGMWEDTGPATVRIGETSAAPVEAGEVVAEQPAIETKDATGAPEIDAKAAKASGRDLGFTRRASTAITVLYLGLYGGAFYLAWSRIVVSSRLAYMTIWVVTIDGLLNVTARALGVPDVGLLGFMVAHTIAALFLPWRPLQAAWPAFIVLPASLFSHLAIEQDYTGLQHVLLGFLSLFTPAPGIAIAWFKHAQRTQYFQMKFLASRYTQVRRELVDARRIHESLFPPEILGESVEMRYHYEPMRAIGGDFLFVHRARGSEDLSVVVLDVTGHGIPAALTVNRLHGELERVFAERADADPGEILRLLNRYVHLTLARHSVYATAFCARISPTRNTLEFASGGHPPAFVCGVDGTIHEIISTAFVLGACPDGQFDSAASRVEFHAGDTLIVYTDGAFEARSPSGKQLGLNGLRAILADGARTHRAGAHAWVPMLHERVLQHRQGPPEDDTLVIEVSRPVSSGAGPRVSLATGTPAVRGT